MTFHHAPLSDGVGVLASETVLLQGWVSSYHPPWLGPDSEKTGVSRSHITILVVDDDEQGRAVTARMLRDEGYNVIEANSGHEALHRLRVLKEVHVVVTDVAMPWLNGVQLAEIVARDYPKTSVILMSGYSSILTTIAKDVRFPLLMKPFTDQQLAERIRALLKEN